MMRVCIANLYKISVLASLRCHTLDMLHMFGDARICAATICAIVRRVVHVSYVCAFKGEVWWVHVWWIASVVVCHMWSGAVVGREALASSHSVVERMPWCL